MRLLGVISKTFIKLYFASRSIGQIGQILSLNRMFYLLSH